MGASILAMVSGRGRGKWLALAGQLALRGDGMTCVFMDS